MKFTKIFPCLIAKAERKGRSQEEVNSVTSWLTGYSPDELSTLLMGDSTNGEFLANAPAMNPARILHFTLFILK